MAAPSSQNQIPKPPNAMKGTKSNRNQGTSILHKTKMCAFYAKDMCNKGSQCSYAHNQQELHVTPNLLQTKMCKNMQLTGKCEDSHCRFAHEGSERRAYHPQVVKSAKSRQGGKKQSLPPHGKGQSYRPPEEPLMPLVENYALPFETGPINENDDIHNWHGVSTGSMLEESDDFSAPDSPPFTTSFMQATHHPPPSPPDNQVPMPQGIRPSYPAMAARHRAMSLLDQSDDVAANYQLKQFLRSDVSLAISLLQSHDGAIQQNAAKNCQGPVNGGYDIRPWANESNQKRESGFSSQFSSQQSTQFFSSVNAREDGGDSTDSGDSTDLSDSSLGTLERIPMAPCAFIMHM